MNAHTIESVTGNQKTLGTAIILAISLNEKFPVQQIRVKSRPNGLNSKTKINKKKDFWFHCDHQLQLQFD